MNDAIHSDIDMLSPPPTSELDEKQDVATVTTDEVEPMEEDLPLADDHEAMKKKYFPPDPDLETLDEHMMEWHIKNYRSQEHKTHSPTFRCGDTPWRLLMFPFGNQNAVDWCSCYLEHHFEEKEKPSDSWYTCVQFLIVAYNPNDPTLFTTNTASHRYTTEATDWGFNKFFEIRKAVHGWQEQGGRPLLEGDSLSFTIYVRTVKDPTGVLWHSFDNYDSKKETDMIGIKNQGATCYLNSLLQSLYLTNAFRKAIYEIPTEEETNARGNSAYALQRLFYLLQHSEKAAGTDELTAAFGWDTRQTFVQQDVQELARLLMDNMEERLKPTPHAKDLSNMFVGSTKTYLKCINVDYESSSSQVWWDIQLNVRGQESLDESFRNNLQVETMDGDNKYFAEGFGLQDAKKGDIYETFPPVLHLQLKRFEFNWEYNQPTKINDKLAFPEQFDASPYLSDEADRSESWIYNLHGVLVHSGDLDAGHYYAFLKPGKDGDFYKFDDDRVTRATKKEAIDENFGGEFASKGGVTTQKNPFTFKYTKHRYMSAYMLVYIRQSRLDEVLLPVGDADVPPHLDRKIKDEQAELERKRKDREEAHLYMPVVIGTTANFDAYQGFDVFPLPSAEYPDKAAVPKHHRLLRASTIKELRHKMAGELNLDSDLVRPWALVGRQNHTIRPDTPMDWDDNSIDEAARKINGKMPFRMWLEIASRREDGTPDFISADLINQAKNPNQPILLFLKYFDVEQQRLSGHGYLYIDKSKRISELGPMILDRMGWPAGANIKLFEEIKGDMIEPLKNNSTFQQAELQSGDIVCFQKHVPEAEATEIAQKGRVTDAKQFYDYLMNRTTIKLYDKNDLENEDKTFDLELSKKNTYDQIAAKVGEHLNVSPDHLRFSAVFQASGRAKAPVRRAANVTLQSITSSQMGIYGSTQGAIRTDVLMYETLEISLTELETKRPMKLTYLSDGITKEEVFDVLVPKTGVVRDFVAPLKKKANLSDDDEKRLRFYEVHGYKIYLDLTEDHPVSKFNEFVTIYAELVTEEEDEADPNVDRMVYCFHFDKDLAKLHSVPFRFIVKPGELFSETKKRLSAKTGIKGKNFDRIKFSVVRKMHSGKPEPLQDDDILADKLIGSEDMLALDHLNKSRTVYKGDVMMIR